MYGMYADEARQAIDEAARNPSSGAPLTFGESFESAWDAQRAYQQSVSRYNARMQVIGDLVEAYRSKVGADLPNPFAIGTLDGTPDGLPLPPDQPFAEPSVSNLRDLYESARKSNPDAGLAPFPTDEQIDAQALDRMRQARIRFDAEHARNPHWFAEFMGGAAASMTDPVNAAAALLAGPAARTVVGEALTQAGMGAASQTAVAALNYDTRRQVDPNYTTASALEEIGEAGAGAAVIGGSVKVLGKLLGRFLSRTDRATLPRSLNDAINIVQSDARDAEKTPFPDDAGANAVHQETVNNIVETLRTSNDAPIDISPEAQALAERIDARPPEALEAAELRQRADELDVSANRGGAEELRKRADELDAQAIATRPPARPYSLDQSVQRGSQSVEASNRNAAKAFSPTTPEAVMTGPATTPMVERLDSAVIQAQERHDRLLKDYNAAYGKAVTAWEAAGRKGDVEDFWPNGGRDGWEKAWRTMLPVQNAVKKAQMDALSARLGEALPDGYSLEVNHYPNTDGDNIDRFSIYVRRGDELVGGIQDFDVSSGGIATPWLKDFLATGKAPSLVERLGTARNSVDVELGIPSRGAALGEPANLNHPLRDPTIGGLAARNLTEDVIRQAAKEPDAVAAEVHAAEHLAEQAAAEGRELKVALEDGETPRDVRDILREADEEERMAEEIGNCVIDKGPMGEEG